MVDTDIDFTRLLQRETIHKEQNEYLFLLERKLNKHSSNQHTTFPAFLSWGSFFEISPKEIFQSCVAGLIIAIIIIPHALGFSNMTDIDYRFSLNSTMIPPLIFALLSNTKQVHAKSDVDWPCQSMLFINRLSLDRPQYRRP